MRTQINDDAFETTSLRWYNPDQVQRVKEFNAFFSQSELSDPPSRACGTIYETLELIIT
jgi:hypothetical protein